MFLFIIFRFVPLLARRGFILFDIGILLYLGFVKNLIKVPTVVCLLFSAAIENCLK